MGTDTLEQFAKQAGVTLVACAQEWGGRIGYRETDRPGATVCGFRSEGAAYRHWLESTFGKHTAAAVRALLRKASTQQKGERDAT